MYKNFNKGTIVYMCDEYLQNGHAVYIFLNNGVGRVYSSGVIHKFSRAQDSYSLMLQYIKKTNKQTKYMYF
jgi:hypothetical protein